MAFAILEAGARVLASSRSAILPELVAVPGADPRAGGPASAYFEPSPLVVADPRFLWRGRPSASLSLPIVPTVAGKAGTWDLAFDSRGFRHVQTPRAATTRRTYRILFVGDSVTLGFNVSQGEEYPAVVARLLSEKYPNLVIDVVNAAVADWSWVQGTEFVIQEGLSLAPDLVIASHGAADRSRASITDSENLWLSDERIAERERKPAPLEWSAAWQLLFASPLGSPEVTAGSISPGCRLQEASGSQCRRVSSQEIGLTVHRLGQATKATGVDLLLIPLDFGDLTAT